MVGTGGADHPATSEGPRRGLALACSPWSRRGHRDRQRPPRPSTINPFNPAVFTTNDNGSISMFGNNLLTCPASARRCAGAAGGTAPAEQQRLLDGEPRRRRRRTHLQLVGLRPARPAGSRCCGPACTGAPAGTGDPVSDTPAPTTHMSFGFAAAGVRRRRTCGDLDADVRPHSGDLAYQEFADVTDHGAGARATAPTGAPTSSPAPARTATPGGRWWSSTATPTQPLRNLTVFDGFADVGRDSPQSIATLRLPHPADRHRRDASSACSPTRATRAPPATRRS